jgi:hypothetical protein
MDIETEARFGRIEQAQEVQAKTLSRIVQAQEANAKILGAVLRAQATLFESLDRLVGAQTRQAEALREFTSLSDERLTRIEKDIEGLIRAITTEHSNGKGKH